MTEQVDEYLEVQKHNYQALSFIVVLTPPDTKQKLAALSTLFAKKLLVLHKELLELIDNDTIELLVSWFTLPAQGLASNIVYTENADQILLMLLSYLVSACKYVPSFRPLVDKMNAGLKVFQKPEIVVPDLVKIPLIEELENIKVEDMTGEVVQTLLLKYASPLGTEAQKLLDTEAMKEMNSRLFKFVHVAKEQCMKLTEELSNSNALPKY